MCDAVAQVFTGTGVGFNFLAFGSQVFMFRRMISERDSTQFTALPSLSLLLCMSLWSAYTVFFLEGRVQLYLANFSGIVFGSVYLIIMIVLGKSFQRRAMLGAALVLLQLVAWAYFIILVKTLDYEAAKNAGGVVTVVVNVSFFFSPMVALRTAWKEKSTKRFPAALSFIMCASGVNWVIAGACIPDYYILVPNAIAIVMGSGQLCVVWLIKRNQSPEASTGGLASEAADKTVDVSSIVPGGPASASTKSATPADQDAVQRGQATPGVVTGASTPANLMFSAFDTSHEARV